MFREDRQNSFTPNTNPPTRDNSGNNSHVFITNIRRDSAFVNFELRPQDSVMLFDVETDKLVGGFPVRNGFPAFGISPIADDLDGDGTDEIIMAANQYLNVFTTTGENFLCTQPTVTCDTTYYDRAFASVYPDTGRPHALPAYVIAPLVISAVPVTGRFVDYPASKLVAVGTQFAQGAPSGLVRFYAPIDANSDALADAVGEMQLFNQGTPIAMSFGNLLYILTDRSLVIRADSLNGTVPPPLDSIKADELHGICRIGDRLVVLAGDSLATFIQVLDTNTNEIFTLGSERFNFGPIVVDLNRDNQPEVVAFTSEGRGILVTVDTSSAAPNFSVLADEETGYEVTTNPVAGDVDTDGYADIIIGGVNAVYVFNRELTLITDYPVQPGDRYPADPVVAAPVIADVERGDAPEVIFPTFVGNINALGREQAYGFPVSAGEIITYLDSIGWIGGYFAAGSPVAFHDSTGGKLGYLGADGWFYAWEVDIDTVTNYWPMYGHDPGGSFAFDNAQLSSPKTFTDLLPKERFYNYPNPVVDGQTRIRFFLGTDATSVNMKMFDLSGVEVASMPCPTSGGIDHEMEMDCSHMTPGIYRCVIEADFGGEKKSIFSDMAVIR
jgi:hypothetical protein